jgi:hypothetical protein
MALCQSFLNFEISGSLCILRVFVYASLYLSIFNILKIKTEKFKILNKTIVISPLYVNMDNILQCKIENKAKNTSEKNKIV